ncbi:4-hydroxythreonine-4-phosphate dehydrogenase PdxA [soil metagenome]
MTAAKHGLPLGLTLGEPAGVGPDLTTLAWMSLRDNSQNAFFVIGDFTCLAQRISHLKLPVPLKRIARAGEAPSVFRDALPVLDMPMTVRSVAGRPSSGTASSVVEWIDCGARLAMAGEASALVTNPIQKETLYAAGFSHQGHTDYLAHLAGGDAEPVMMLIAGGLRTVPVTVHIPLARVAAELTGDLILRQARVTARELTQRFGIARPRLTLTGLNPHAGEGGAMGKEEELIIAPAVAQLRAEGFDVSGPISADTAFHEEARRGYDAILCMYHDQALIPVKTLDFHGGVNCTLGLPFIRTSPDHGTALGLAGTGKANPRSLMAAIATAVKMAAHGG